jgi:Fe2+ or Zn2+ uptake regulation protein
VILGYSELVKEILGVKPETVQRELATLLRAEPTQQRMDILSILATREHATVSELLKEANRSYTGGSYRTTRSFFHSLVKLGILVEKKVGRRTYYIFHSNTELRAWLSES